jgi:hypothetical protein
MAVLFAPAKFAFRFTPKANVVQQDRNVRFVAKPAIAATSILETNHRLIAIAIGRYGFILRVALYAKPVLRAVIQSRGAIPR